MDIPNLRALSRPAKRVLFWVFDTLLLPFTLYLAFALRYGTPSPYDQISDAWPLFLFMTGLGGVVISLSGLPNIKLSAFEIGAVVKIGLASGVMVFLAVMLSYFLKLPGPRSIPLIFGTLFFLSSMLARIIALSFFSWLYGGEKKRQRVAIYGAGAGGIQMAAALQQSSETRPILFVDDNPNLHGLLIAGLRVYSPAQLNQLARNKKIERVLLTMPSISEARRRTLVEHLSEINLVVQVLPSYTTMMADNGTDYKGPLVSPDSLLGRDKVALDIPEISKTYAGRVLMITGAGGSIGSELCRQMINRRPARIVLFEQSEYALYVIEQELRKYVAKGNVLISPRLGSVADKSRVAAVISEEGVDIVLHAAAYKHVPLIEENELEGARNNVLGTLSLAEAAAEAGVERFILISTDKAVRPTNIMGATKRMAELVVQDMQVRHPTTRFAMVRFGNVLGSSGSVLPLFERQIEQGGPVTVTHKDVTRFFMTIPEAARLVLLAGAYAEGGDVFVLDMGKPQKIIDIARRMINLSGRTVRDPETGRGDIDIEVVGLRPGEKLYEELLIDSGSLRTTPHPKILRAEESMLSQIEVDSMLQELRASLADSDSGRLRRLVETWVEGYHIQR